MFIFIATFAQDQFVIQAQINSTCENYGFSVAVSDRTVYFYDTRIVTTEVIFELSVYSEVDNVQLPMRYECGSLHMGVLSDQVYYEDVLPSYSWELFDNCIPIYIYIYINEK
jgi:hypothetical protein